MVSSVELIRPRDAAFDEALKTILGRPADDVLKPALPYSVIVRNRDARAIALLGMRFDMLGPKAKKYSVVHYADMLRHPEKADLRTGAMRFVCAEPLYTDLVLRRESVVDQRGPMNLKNLRTMLRVSASIDCVAFEDGQFSGPDSLRAFERFECEREAEIAFLAELEQGGCAAGAVLARAMDIPAEQSRDRGLLARRALARRLQQGFTTGGAAEMAMLAANHRLRLQLWR
ncbi:MAG TPA: hypothetical protein VK789_03375 [Bryobacteraceae bacterium]|nr:hypothetical protein [Bryobacteraceae bacterium]